MNIKYRYTVCVKWRVSIVLKIYFALVLGQIYYHVTVDIILQKKEKFKIVIIFYTTYF